LVLQFVQLIFCDCASMDRVYSILRIHVCSIYIHAYKHGYIDVSHVIYIYLHACMDTQGESQDLRSQDAVLPDLE
jgi:hypothetical protein